MKFDGICAFEPFNAATALRPWRTRAPLRCQSLQCGHGPEAVENERWATAPTCPRSLQCGHGPEAVENGIVYRNHWFAVYLQCGHGPEAVENPVYPAPAVAAYPPSMRPRP